MCKDATYEKETAPSHASSANMHIETIKGDLRPRVDIVKDCTMMGIPLCCWIYLTIQLPLFGDALERQRYGEWDFNFL